MVKFNKCKSFKRYLFAGSLLLLFLGTLAMTTNVFAVCQDLRQFNCTVTKICSGEIVDISEECANLCISGDTAYLYSASFYFQLRFLDSESLLGTDSSYPVGGCYVRYKSRDMKEGSMKVYYIPLIGATGCKYHFQCTPC